MNNIQQIPTFPAIEYSYKIEQLLFEQGTMLVKYLPAEQTLPSVTYNIPIWPDMDINNLKPYLDKWAPYSKWYAQSVILNSGNSLIGDQ
jgi:hypothetical protein